MLTLAVVSRTHSKVSRLLSSIGSSEAINTKDLEVLCSWNGPPSEEKLIEIPQEINFRIASREPYHFARNINKLARIAARPFFCICNDDIVLDSHTLSAAIHWLQKPYTSVLGAKLRFPNGKIQHIGVEINPADYTPFHTKKGTDFEDSTKTSSPLLYSAATGALLFCATELIRRVPMRESFEECGEDICFCLDTTNTTGIPPIVPNEITAIHEEGGTRSKLKRQGTPPKDLEEIKRACSEHLKRTPQISILTEEEGWILHRKGEEIQRNSTTMEVFINQPERNADLVYFIHYARYDPAIAKGKISVANFTHTVPGTNTEAIFHDVANKVDHCIAISESTKSQLLSIGIPEHKITAIEVGASNVFKPKVVLGIVGRTYGDGRKGEDLVKEILGDRELGEVVEVYSTNHSWGCKTLDVELKEFYNLIDFLLVPSRQEGGPVPFMEALACGKKAIAPSVGVIPSYPHINFKAGDYESLKKTILRTASEILQNRHRLRSSIHKKDWQGWSFKHEIVFRKLLYGSEWINRQTEFTTHSTTLLTRRIRALIDDKQESKANTLLINAEAGKLIPPSSIAAFRYLLERTKHK